MLLHFGKMFGVEKSVTKAVCDQRVALLKHPGWSSFHLVRTRLNPGIPVLHPVGRFKVPLNMVLHVVQ